MDLYIIEKELKERPCTSSNNAKESKVASIGVKVFKKKQSH